MGKLGEDGAGDNGSGDLTVLAVQLLSAYLANNTVAADVLPALIANTRQALAAPLSSPPTSLPDDAAEPAVSIRRSLASPDHIFSMIDGKAYKTLKRHLAAHGLTPAQYRDRFKLPANYPMVAPGYSEHRRAVALRLGLGRKPAAVPQTRAAPAAAAEAVSPKPAARKGRPAAKPVSGRKRAVGKKAGVPEQS